jgi:type IV secretory pathway protease TraF
MLDVILPIDDSTFVSAIASDGGTISASFTDSAGESFDIFIDRRIGTETRDHIYSVAHPASPDSKYHGEFPDLVANILRLLNEN